MSTRLDQYETQPPSRRSWRAFFAVVALVALAAILYVVASGCASAPHSTAELVAMPQIQFENWRDRLANIGKEAARECVAHNERNAQVAAHVSAGLRGLVGKPIGGDALAALRPDDDGNALLAIAIDEVQAWLLEHVGHALDDPDIVAARPRIDEILLAVAAGIDAGAAAALGHPPPAPGPGDTVPACCDVRPVDVAAIERELSAER